MPDASEQFFEGMRAVVPVLPSIIPFGMIAGVTALQAGFTPLQTSSLSLFVFAGASQLTAIELFQSEATLLVIVTTALVINLRLVMYSASLAPHLQCLSKRWKLPLAHLLVDQVYALSLVKFREDDITDPRWYYLGAALPSWCVWGMATLAGILLGTEIPSSWQFGFTVPLLFLALLFPTIEDCPTMITAIVTGIVTVIGINFPYELGVVVSTVTGITAGLLVEGWISS